MAVGQGIIQDLQDRTATLVPTRDPQAHLHSRTGVPMGLVVMAIIRVIKLHGATVFHQVCLPLNFSPSLTMPTITITRTTPVLLGRTTLHCPPDLPLQGCRILM